MNILGAAALGLALGAITGMPLGVINVAIVDAAHARHRAYATGLGLGGASADTIHAALAFLGIGRVVAAHPEWLRAMAIVAACVIIGYAVLAWRRHRQPSAIADGSLARGVGAGIALTLPNPGALAAWGAIAAALWPSASLVEALVVAAGVGLGSAAWFTLLGRVVATIRRDHPALRVIPHAALVLFVGIAVIGVARSW